MPGGTYPSIDYWGANTYFFGSVVPPMSFYNGGAFVTVEIHDPMDSGTWGVGFSSMAHAGWYGISEEDFPAYVDVVPAGPIQIDQYRELGYRVIRIE